MACSGDKRASSLREELGKLFLSPDNMNTENWKEIVSSLSETFRPELVFTGSMIKSHSNIGLESASELSSLREAMEKVLAGKKLNKAEREAYNKVSNHFEKDRQNKVAIALGQNVTKSKLGLLPFDMLGGIVDSALTKKGEAIHGVVKYFEKNKIAVSNMIIGSGSRKSVAGSLSNSYRENIQEDDSNYNINNVVNVVTDDMHLVVADEVTGKLVGEYRKIYKAMEAGSIIVAKAGRNIKEKFDKNEMALEENLIKNGYTRSDTIVPGGSKGYENYIGVWTKNGVNYDFNSDRPTYNEVKAIATGSKTLVYNNKAEDIIKKEESPVYMEPVSKETVNSEDDKGLFIEDILENDSISDAISKIVLNLKRYKKIVEEEIVTNGLSALGGDLFEASTNLINLTEAPIKIDSIINEFNSADTKDKIDKVYYGISKFIKIEKMNIHKGFENSILDGYDKIKKINKNISIVENEQAWYDIDSKELITKVYKKDLEKIKVNKIDNANMKRTKGLGFTPSTIEDNISGVTREDSTGIYEAMNHLFGGSWNRIESKYLEKYGYPTKKELEEFNELNKSGIFKKVALHKFETGVYKTKKEAEEQLNKNMRRYIDIQNSAKKALNMFMENEGKVLIDNNTARVINEAREAIDRYDDDFLVTIDAGDITRLNESGDKYTRNGGKKIETESSIFWDDVFSGDNTKRRLNSLKLYIKNTDESKNTTSAQNEAWSMFVDWSDRKNDEGEGLNIFPFIKRENKLEDDIEIENREKEELESLVRLIRVKNLKGKGGLSVRRGLAVLESVMKAYSEDKNGSLPAGFFNSDTNTIHMSSKSKINKLTDDEISSYAKKYEITTDEVKYLMDYTKKNNDTQALAHEFVHGATLYYLNRNMFSDDVVKLMKDFNDIKENVDSLDNYWKTDVHEFIAEYATQPKLRESIREYNEDKDSTIVSFIKKLFGIKTESTDDIVNAVMKNAYEKNVNTDRVDAFAVYQVALSEKNRDAYKALLSMRNKRTIEEWLRKNRNDEATKHLPLPSSVDKNLDKYFGADLRKGSTDSGLGLSEDDELAIEEIIEPDMMESMFVMLHESDSEEHTNTHFSKGYMEHVQNILGIFSESMSIDKKNKMQSFNLYQTEDESKGTKAEYTKRLNSDGTYTTSIDILYNEEDNTATSSEMYLHEANHQFINGAFELNPSLKKDAEKLRQQIINEGLITYEVFLAKIESPTDIEIARAKEKFDYIFSQQASTEEFISYATSNSLLYEALDNIKYDDSINDIKINSDSSVIDRIIAIFKNAFRTMIPVAINGKKGTDIIASTTMAIHEYNIKMQALGQNPRLLRRLAFTGAIDMTGTSNMILQADELIGKLEKLDIKINPKLDKAIRTIGSITYSYYNGSLKKGTVGALESIAKIKSVEKILNTRLVQNVGEQLFGRTKFKNGTSQFYQMYRQAKLLTDSYVNTSKGEIRRALTEKSLFSPKNELKAQVFNNAIVATGMHEFMGNKTANNMTIESIDSQLNKLREKMNGVISQQEISHLEALAKSTLDGKAHIENQKINAYNVLRAFTNKDLSVDKETVTLAKEYTSMYALSKMDKDSISIVREMLSDEGMNKEVMETSVYYSKLIKRLEITYMSRDSSFFPVPHNFTHKSTTGNSKVLTLVHESDYDKSRTLYGNVKIHDKMDILGETFYKVSYMEPSNQFDEGMLNSVAFQTKGLSIKDAIKRVYMERKGRDEIGPEIENSKQFVDKYFNSYGWRKKLNTSEDYTGKEMTMPVHGENGSLKDIIIPFSKSDESMIMNKDDYSVETLSATLSRALDIMTAKNNNAKAIMLLNKFYQENMDNKKYKFIELSKFKAEKDWGKLSPTIKAMITDLSDTEDSLMIPSRLWELIVGSEQSSLSNLKIAGKEVFKKFSSKKNVKFIEDIVASIFQKNKTALILFNPDVFSGNMISNMHIAYSHGVPPTKFMPQFKSLWTELDEFEKLSKRKAYLLVQKGMGNDVTNELKMVKSRLRNSGFAPLVNDGQFTAFSDDLEEDNETILDGIINKYIAKDIKDEAVVREIFTEAYTRFQAGTRDGGSLEDYVKEVKREYRKENRVSPMKLPHQLRKISDIVYGSKGTTAHKIGEKLTIYGDVIPKRMILDQMVSDYQKQHNQAVPNDKMQEFLNELDEKFINYSYNTSGVQKWMEKVGGLWFLKYFLRHGKGYIDVAKRNPTSIIKQQLIPYAFGIEIADPTDTHLDNTVYENVIKNRWKGDELLDQIGEAIAPNLFMPFDLSQNTFFRDAL